MGSCAGWAWNQGTWLINLYMKASSKYLLDMYFVKLVLNLWSYKSQCPECSDVKSMTIYSAAWIHGLGLKTGIVFHPRGRNQLWDAA